MLQVQWIRYILDFKFKARTSRGILTERTSFFITIRDTSGSMGIGECSPLTGLSPDDRPNFEEKLNEVCRKVSNSPVPELDSIYEYVREITGGDWPSIRLGLETAWLDFLRGGLCLIFENSRDLKIPVNGLVWMGNRDFMLEQIRSKIGEGYACIKMKIGALDFDTELSLVEYIRKKYSEDKIAIRLDANGAFPAEEALSKLERLSRFGIHSIEQPIAAGQMETLRRLCSSSPVPIALDEELIGLYNSRDKEKLLVTVKPAYIVLKPTLLGGFYETAQWIELAEKHSVGWWITSALESNIGLNAITQFTAQYPVSMPQGLGTGQLYRNNIPAPLSVKDGFIRLTGGGAWDLRSVT